VIRLVAELVVIPRPMGMALEVVGDGCHDTGAAGDGGA
jgi:hypothetical protein